MTPGTKKLKAEVKRRELTVRAAADLVGCKKSAMQRYLAGDRVPNDGAILARIEHVFGVAPSSFYAAPRKKSKAA